MNIGEKIQQLRKAKNLSQEQLAVQLEVSRQAVSKWELNESTPDTDKIILISKIFSVSTDYLLLENPEVVNVIETEVKIDNDLQRSKSMTIAALFISILGLIITFTPKPSILIMVSYWECPFKLELLSFLKS